MISRQYNYEYHMVKGQKYGSGSSDYKVIFYHLAFPFQLTFANLISLCSRVSDQYSSNHLMSDYRHWHVGARILKEYERSWFCLRSTR